MQDRYTLRPTFPENSRGSNLVHNKPDVPIVERMALHKLSYRLPGSVFTRTQSAGVSTRETTLPGYSRESRIRGIQIIPEVIRPALKFRVTGVGGNRTIGGGTSKEAIGRAKHQAKRHNSK